MLSIQECRKYLEGMDLTDEQIEEIRNDLYSLGDLALECYFKEKLKTKDQPLVS